MPMNHAQAVAAGRKAARTRWGPDGKKGTPKSRAKVKAKGPKVKKGRKGMSHAKAVAAGRKAARTRKRNKSAHKRKKK